LHIATVVICGVDVEVDVGIGIIVVTVVSTILEGFDNGNDGGTFIFAKSFKGVGFLVVNSIGSGGLSIIKSGQLIHG
jgi:hypothetical protein